MSGRFISSAFWLWPLKWGALIAAILISVDAFGQTSVVMTLGSRHLDGGEFCETNLGLGLERGDTWRTIGGFYKNSLCRTSVYLGGTYQPFRRDKWRLGGVALGATGYTDDLTLGAGLALTYEDSFNAIWFPNKKGNFTKGVLGLQLVRKW